MTLDRARAALGTGAWTDALTELGALAEDDGPQLADALEVQAAACYGAGDLERSLGSWERLYDLHEQRGETEQAGRAAAMTALHLLIDSGLMATVRGWNRRAEELLGPTPESPVWAMVAMVAGYERFFSGDPVAARELARRAVELGRERDVVAAVVVGRTALARLRILDGAVEEGLELLDEVAIELTSERVDPLTAGMMLCELVCAAQGVGRHDRAREWTEVMQRWRPGRAVGGINGRCRVHRAEMLRWSGPGEEAEAEAVAACEELRPWMRREYGWPLVELGTIRLRLGDLVGAEEALLEAHEHAWCPQPALALLRLAQGRGEEALALLDEAVAHPLPMPSKERPPFVELRVAPLLEAQAEVAAVLGRPQAVARAAERLEAIAQRWPGPGLCAAAALARARAELAAGRPAVEAGTAAVAAWADAEAAYETAGAREVLAAALDAAGRPDAARLERDSALVAYQAFGAALDVRRLLAVAGQGEEEPGERAPGPPVAVFERLGSSRRVALGGVERVLPDLKGLRYLERLLVRPGEELHVLDLVAGEADPQAPEGVVRVDAPGLLVLDEEAKAAYRRRLAEVEDDLEEAVRTDDLARQEMAARDRDYLLAELSRAVGLGGRDRRTGGSAERARTSVTRSLRYGLARLAEQHPDLGDHLSRRVRTGTYCCYEPDPLSPVTWRMGQRG
ncbi:tetratricopeptide (TPR) repeat protein [Nocardioides marinisabuli]|uniref:Tetratricopeptide (TPR) repeat protein n=1 Tax=Nocardioides marinisabuli TaxID=419476 RepID=A0A7Y9JQZ2_9ACTN|nr:hypothetical protein [Nocardioides marinisabuli]NYD57955.1 tetratricopeptide (TPR) repeat protein [Nocardioides marinisabuli]